MPAKQRSSSSLRLRLARSRTAGRVRRQLAVIDNPEVRKARMLARLARAGNLDILEFGDSVVAFTADYDTDQRPLHQMVRDSLDPELVIHAIHGGGYNPLLFDGFLRQLEGTAARPVVILPLAVRVGTFPLINHPYYSHERANRFLSTLDGTTSLRQIRKMIRPPTAEEFNHFHSLRFSTWAGNLTIGDYVRTLRSNHLSENDAAKMLYAYLHGGKVEHGAPLDTLRELGERLRRLDLPVVIYQTPVPVEKGVELHGQNFYELAKRNFAMLEDAFVSEYGDVPVLQTGLTAPTSHFIDWHDGTEHLNDVGRSALANAVVDATRLLISRQHSA